MVLHRRTVKGLLALEWISEASKAVVALTRKLRTDKALG
jgi:hypothetical protein